MRIAVSNLAWDRGEDDSVARLLRERAVDAIDLVPAKYFPDVATAADGDVRRVADWWAERGVGIVGMQALMHGTSGLNLFGAPESRAAMLRHLTAVCRIGALLGAHRLTLGAPRCRDRTGRDDAQVRDLAAEFFASLAAIAASAGVVVCVEPVPGVYGGNYLVSTAETARLVESCASRSLRLQLDTGAIALEGADVEADLADWAPLAGHIHASEPGLVPLGDGPVDHARMAAAFARHLPEHVVTIEMIAATREPHLAAIDRAIGVALRHYGPPRAPA